MKIEFCCEEMRKAIIVGNAAVDWRYEGKAEKVVRIRDTCADYPSAYLTTCPYCGAKIEITVMHNPRYGAITSHDREVDTILCKQREV